MKHFLESHYWFIAAKPLETISGDETCGVCETIIQYVDSLLEENSTVETVERVLQKVCNYMPESFKSDVSIINSFNSLYITFKLHFALAIQLW